MRVALEEHLYGLLDAETSEASRLSALMRSDESALRSAVSVFRIAQAMLVVESSYLSRLENFVKFAYLRSPKNHVLVDVESLKDGSHCLFLGERCTVRCVDGRRDLMNGTDLVKREHVGEVAVRKGSHDSY